MPSPQEGLLLDSMACTGPDAEVVVGPDGTVVRASDAVQDLLGWSREQLLDRPSQLLVPDDDRVEHLAARAHALATGRVCADGVHRRGVRADGTVVDLVLEPRVLDVGMTRYLAVVLRPAPRPLLDDPGLVALVRALAEPVLLLDDACRVLVANAALADLLGRRVDEVERGSLDVLVPDDAEAAAGLRRAVVRVARSGRAATGSDLALGRGDGTRFRAELALTPLPGATGPVVLGRLRDLDAAASGPAVVLEGDRMRDDLLGTVSHELRTPLTSIIGYVELLKDLPEPELGAQARRMVAIIERNAARELRLVTDLLTLAHLDDLADQLAVMPLALAGVANGAVEALRLQARQRAVTLDTELDQGLIVHGDPQRLGQLVDNLLLNAVKFTPAGGRVVLRTERREGHVVLSVHDDGPGIPEHELPRVFDRMWRGAAAVREQVPGAGLGLTIAQAIAAAHGGRVSIDSREGEGTRAELWLPTSGPRASAPAGG